MERFDPETKDFECVGGPMDGKTLPVPVVLPNGEPGEHALVVHLDHEARVVHFYIADWMAAQKTPDDKAVLIYGGTDLRNALNFVRRINPELADNIEEDFAGLIEAVAQLENQECDEYGEEDD